MNLLKFNHYEDAQTEYTLCTGIEDLYHYDLKLPEPPKPEKIINFGKPVHEQTFQRIVLHKEIKSLNYIPREDAIKAVDNNPNWYNYVESLWRKMIYGEWQYINGKPLYISPSYWFYLNFWPVSKEGLPQFRYDTEHYCTDLWNFAWWDLMIVPSDVCFGELSVAARRDGKSFRALCKGYRQLILNKMGYGALQSKTEDDAISCFSKKCVEPWLNLPFFFKPFHSGGSYPKSEGFRFEPPSLKGEVARNTIINPDDYLMGFFKPFNSSETACDGEKWLIHITDEDGKGGKELDVWERWMINRPCLTDNGRISGKEITTTTVEDIERTGAAKFKYKWILSGRDPNKPADQLMVNGFGETASGLWSWFTPSYCNAVWNKYGKAIVGEPTKTESDYLRAIGDKKFLKGGRQRIDELINRPGLSDTDRQKEMRKFARTVKEIFIAAGGYCYFDIAILNKRLSDFQFGWPADLRGKMAFGNFEWKNIYGGEVEFISCDQSKAKWYLSYMPGEGMRNKWNLHPNNGKKNPANWHKFVSGADAFKFDTADVIDKNRMSQGTMTIYAEYDVNVDVPGMNPDDYVTDDICGEYMARPDTVDDLCEDYLKACIFFGMKLFPEKNNPDVVSYFRRNGFENYLQFDMGLKKQDSITFLAEKGAGANTDVKSIQSMFKVVQRYVKEKGLRCKFPRTLEQLTQVAPDNMNPYDLFVSLATCLRVVQDFNPIRFAADEQGDDVGDIRGFTSPTMPSPMGAMEGGGYGVDNF